MQSQQPIFNLTRDELLEKCLDLRLPVSRFDSYQTLENFFKVAKDEAGETNSNPDSADVLELEEEEPVYIGKFFSFRYVLGKVLTLI